MSGIAGIIHFDGRPVTPGQIEAMTAAMDYRGPDGIAHWVQGSVALGQCMLRTTPESLEETQPLANEDGNLILVMDGRIDNWEALRRELLARGARLRTRADAELLLRAYEIWGEACVEQVDGDFAFALWDARQRRLFCARDRVGNRQFHYHWNGSSFAFATDTHPLLDLPWVPEQVDEDTLAEYLATDWLTIDTTLWHEVKRLKPAYRLTVSGIAKADFTEYWAPDPFASLHYASDAEYIAHYRDLFTDVCRRMLRSQQPLSIEVSGGLDSSSIFATAMHLQAEGRFPAPGIEAYTLDFSGDPDADELGYAQQVGAFHGTTVHAIPPAFMPLDWYRETARRFRAFPHFPNGVMHQNILDRARDNGSRVLVGGTGGDEWSGGGMPYAELMQLRQWRTLGRLWREERQTSGLSQTAARFLRHGALPLLPEGVKRSLRASRDLAIRRGATRHDWLTPHMRQRLESLRGIQTTQTKKPIARLGQHRQWDHIHAPYWQFAKGIMERNCALSALEWRQPFWSHRLLEFAFATPEHLRNRLGMNRWLHLQAMQGRLPESVRLRQTKAEFSSSFKTIWPQLRGDIGQIALRRAEWVQVKHLQSRLEVAFTPQSTDWDEGPPWLLFGLDACLPVTL